MSPSPATRLSLVLPSLPRPPRRTPQRTGERVHLILRGATWWVHYTLDGRRIRESLKTDNRKIAEDRRIELEDKLRNRLLERPREVLLAPFLDEYLAYQKARKTPKGFHNDRVYLSRFFEACPIRRLSDLTTPLVSAYLTTRRTRDGIAPKTANRIRECLHTMGSYAVAQGYLPQNPVSKVKRYPEPDREIVFLTKPQIEELLAVVKDDGIAPLVATLIFAGLRRGEAVWLTWTDVDLGEKPVLRIVSKTRNGQGWTPKTKRNRVVPLHPRLAEILRALPHTSDWVFPSPLPVPSPPPILPPGFRALGLETGV